MTKKQAEAIVKRAKRGYALSMGSFAKVMAMSSSILHSLKRHKDDGETQTIDVSPDILRCVEKFVAPLMVPIDVAVNLLLFISINCIDFDKLISDANDLSIATLLLYCSKEDAEQSEAAVEEIKRKIIKEKDDAFDWDAPTFWTTGK